MDRKGGGKGIASLKGTNSKKLLDKGTRGCYQHPQGQLHYLPYDSEQNLAKYLLAKWFHERQD